MNNKKLIQTIIFAIAAVGFTLLSYIICGSKNIPGATHAAIWFTTGGIIIAGVLTYLIKNTENGIMDFANVSFFYVSFAIIAGILELALMPKVNDNIKWIVVIQLALFIFYVLLAFVFMGNKKEKETYKKAG